MIIYLLRSLPLYIKPVSWVIWGTVLFKIGIVFYIVFIYLGVWQLTKHGLEFVWVAPVIFYIIIAIFAVISAIGSAPVGKLRWGRFVCWISIGFLISALSIVVVMRDWECQYIVQCFLCMAITLEYAFWKWWLHPLASSVSSDYGSLV